MSPARIRTAHLDIESLLRPDIADMEEYTPIVPFEVLSKRLGIPPDQIVKLDANENPYGAVPAVSAALAEYSYYHIYPDPEQGELRAALSEYVGVPADNILATHGADEMLDYLCRLMLRPGDRIVDCPPTFGMYTFDAGLSGGSVVTVKRNAGFSVDSEGLRRAVLDSTGGPPVKIVFLTSPNNPSGNWLSDEELLAALELPAMVVLDEAYVEFADHNSRAGWVLAHDNLVVLRTFSKAAGIAGLRLGYGICPSWLMTHLWKFKQPYNVNVAAAVAGLASLRHRHQIDEVVQKLKLERARLYDALRRVSYLRPYPSEANFILCDVIGRDAKALKVALEQSGILVRHYNKPGLQNCIRISVGRPEQTDRLLQALTDL